MGPKNTCLSVQDNENAIEEKTDEMVEEMSNISKRCFFCSFESENPAEINEHIFLRHSKAPILEGISCKICKVHSTNLHLFRIFHHSCSRPTEHQLPVFHCHICPFKAAESEDFKNHLVESHLEECPDCHLKTISREFLKSHACSQEGQNSEEEKIEKVATSVRDSPYFCQQLDTPISSSLTTLQNRKSGSQISSEIEVQPESENSPLETPETENGFENVPLEPMAKAVQSAKPSKSSLQSNGSTVVQLQEKEENDLLMLQKEGNDSPKLQTESQKKRERSGSSEPVRKKSKIAESAKPVLQSNESNAVQGEKGGIDLPTMLDPQIENLELPENESLLDKTLTCSESDEASGSITSILPSSKKKRQQKRISMKQYPKESKESCEATDKVLPKSILDNFDGKKCKICGHVGKMRYDTIRHIQRTHLKLASFSCNNCDFSHPKLKELKEHFAQNHQGTEEKDALGHHREIELTEKSFASGEEEIHDYQRRRSGEEGQLEANGAEEITNVNEEEERRLINLKEREEVSENGSSVIPEETSRHITKVKRKTSKMRPDRALYDLIHVPCEDGFKKLIPIIEKFYACKLCKWNFERKEDYLKHSKELHQSALHVMKEKKISQERQQPEENVSQCHVPEEQAPAEERANVEARHEERCDNKVAGVDVGGGGQNEEKEAKPDAAELALHGLVGARGGCLFCNFKSGDKAKLVDHLKSNHVDLNDGSDEPSCKVCHWKNSDIYAVFSHVKKTHVEAAALSKADAERTCSKCKQVFPDPALLAVHCKMSHCSSSPRKKASVGKLKCAVCAFTTNESNVLVAHVTTQHNEARIDEVIVDYKCPICHQRHEDALKLSKHLHQSHVKDLSRKCCYCGEVRSSRGANLRHIDVIHLDIRRYPCPTCHHRFTCQRDLNNHLHVHANELTA